MERIASFTVDHNVLVPGLYLSRRDGNVVTFDLRPTRPARCGGASSSNHRWQYMRGVGLGMTGVASSILAPPAAPFIPAVGESSALPSAGHFWPQRLTAHSLPCLRRPHFFQQRKKWGKERRPKPMVLGISLCLF